MPQIGQKMFDKTLTKMRNGKMKTLTLDIIKKNRKYFACTNSNGYKCKLVIDANSENLETGRHELLVDDISVRSKYGTDLIYKLSSSSNSQKNAGITTLQHHTYNSKLVDECRKLGGKWDADEKVWLFNGIVENEVEELDYKYNSELINVKLTALDDICEYHSGVEVVGHTIARAYDRDGGATLQEGVALVSGTVTSGGSRKNWTTVVREGAVIKMQIPQNLISEIDSDEWDVKII
jgi:DNA-binding Xre family transcriptional regulator